MGRTLNSYQRILEAIFTKHYKPDASRVGFARKEIPETADRLGIRGLWWEEEGVRAWICYSKGDVILQEVKPFDLSTKIEDLP